MYSKGAPLYPFGYGLSYTSFEFSNLMTSGDSIGEHGQITISVDVRNSGSRVGDEVVQMYVAHTDSKVARPTEELKGFKRITLRPGEKTTVQFALKGSDLVYWNVEKGAWDLEPDQVSIMIGSSSADLKLKRAVNVE
jgi:beta-glucosidase